MLKSDVHKMFSSATTEQEQNLRKNLGLKKAFWNLSMYNLLSGDKNFESVLLLSYLRTLHLLQHILERIYV